MSQDQEERTGPATGDDSVNVNLSTGQEASDVPNQQEDEDLKIEPSGYKYGICQHKLKYDPLTIVFAVLVFIGGLIGYITKDSTISLVAGLIFAVLLCLFCFIDGAQR